MMRREPRRTPHVPPGRLVRLGMRRLALDMHIGSEPEVPGDIVLQSAARMPQEHRHAMLVSACVMHNAGIVFEIIGHKEHAAMVIDAVAIYMNVECYRGRATLGGGFEDFYVVKRHALHLVVLACGPKGHDFRTVTACVPEERRVRN